MVYIPRECGLLWLRSFLVRPTYSNLLPACKGTPPLLAQNLSLSVLTVRDGYDPVQARWPHSSQGLTDIIKERRNFSRYQRHKGRFSSLKVCSLAAFPTSL